MGCIQLSAVHCIILHILLPNFFCLPSFRVFEKSLQYVKRFSRYKNPDAVRQVREYPLLVVLLQLFLKKNLFDPEGGFS